MRFLLLILSFLVYGSSSDGEKCFGEVPREVYVHANEEDKGRLPQNEHGKDFFIDNKTGEVYSCPWIMTRYGERVNSSAEECDEKKPCAEGFICNDIQDVFGNENFEKKYCVKEPKCPNELEKLVIKKDDLSRLRFCDEWCGPGRRCHTETPGYSGFCCSYEVTCPEYVNEKEGTTWTVRKDSVCDDCQNKTCPWNITDNVLSICREVRDKNHKPRGYHLCQYTLGAGECDTSLRNIPEIDKWQEWTECADNEDCDEGYCSDLHAGSTINFIGEEKICCKPDLCGLSLLFGDQIQDCTEDSKCKGENVKCDHLSDRSICCPDLIFINGDRTKGEPTVPYITNVPCDGAIDCRYGAFCDPVDKVCVFHVGASMRKPLNISCDYTNDHCPHSAVCVREQRNGSCYKNPLDPCYFNSDCKEDEFCDVHSGRKRRASCEKADEKAAVQKDKPGLTLCKTKQDCDNHACRKNIFSMNITIPKGYGYCTKQECYVNMDCDDGEFCNVHVAKNETVLCEKPLDLRSIIEKDRPGLIMCYTKRQCKDYQQSAIECTPESTSPNVIIPANMTGHCAYNKLIKCRGVPRVDYNGTEPITCTRNSDCQSGEFCDIKAIVGSRYTFTNFPEGEGICCSKPNTGGEVRNKKEIGLETCNLQKTDGCQDLEHCVTNFNRGEKSLWDSEHEGVCSKFHCTQKPKYEVSLDELVIAGNECDLETSPGSCESAMDTVAVCEQFPSETPHSRCCKYKRIVSTCESTFLAEVRDKQGNAFPCDYSFQCRAHKNAKCGAPKSPIPGIQKMCCEAQVCSDHFTSKVDSENSCTRDEECEENGMKGQCDGGYCCPIVSNEILEAFLEDPNVVIEAEYPFKTPVPCTKVTDCEGELRFCDAATNRCTYYGPNLVEKKESCSLTNMTCGEIDGDRTVCLLEGHLDENETPRCYKHPLDNCKKNEDCKQGEYCGVALDVPTELTGLANRMCRKVPNGALVNETGIGLKECSADEDCGDAFPPLICHLEEPGVRSYCRTVPLLVCHGKPLAKYVGRKQATCMKNSDCGENAFCDMDIERTEGFSKDDGVCCSVPEKCGGEAVTREEVGLSVCQADDQCSLANGEICSKRFIKEPESRWTEEDGVCCKMVCPNITYVEAEKMTVYASERCGNKGDGSCEIDTSYIKLCTPAPDANYKRCCAYGRRNDLCPADIGEVQRENGRVKECKGKDQKCRGKGVCVDEVCCEPDTCGDFQTLKYKEKTCTIDKNCQQPKGFSAECLGGFCCPQTTGQVLKEAFLSNIKCSSVSDCPYSKMYCHSKHGRCAYKLARTNEDLNLEGKCATKTSKDCKGKDGRVGICLYPNGERNGLPSCSLEGAKEVATEASVIEEESNTGLIVGIIIGAIILVLVIAGIVGYVIYRKFANKNKKKKLNRLSLPTAKTTSPPKTLRIPKKPAKSIDPKTPTIESTNMSQRLSSQGRECFDLSTTQKEEIPKSCSSNVSSAHSKPQSVAQSKPVSYASTREPISRTGTKETTTAQ